MLQQHIEHVSKVFAKLEEIDFKVNLKKTEFHKQEIKYLRFIIGTKGISIDPNKVKPIQEWLTLKNIRDIQSFLGLANYNQKFIKDYSKIATPLTWLTRKDVPFQWKDKQQAAFKKLKEMCTTALTL